MEGTDHDGRHLPFRRRSGLPGADPAELRALRRRDERRVEPRRTRTLFDPGDQRVETIPGGGDRIHRTCQGNRNRRGGEKRRNADLRDLRARRIRRRAFGRRDDGFPAAENVRRNDAADQEDRPRSGADAEHIRAVQHAVDGQGQRDQGDRMQSARVAELPVRIEGAEGEFHRYRDQSDARRRSRSAA